MKVGIIYGSSTGNTKRVGEIIKASLKDHQVDRKVEDNLAAIHAFASRLDTLLKT